LFPPIVLAAVLILALAVAAILWCFLSEPVLRSLKGMASSFRDCIEGKRRAEALLRKLLSEEEYRQLTWRGYLEVRSPSIPNRVYHIPKYRGQVHVYEQGRRVMVLCVQPTEPVPDADVVLMHKLMIEGNEQEYLRVANRLEPTSYRHYL